MKRVAILSTFIVVGWISAALLTAPVLAMPLIGAGWEVDADIEASDRVLAADTDSEDGAYLYSLLRPAAFRITDAFTAGDVWRVYDFGTLILTTQFVGLSAGFGDNATADAAWASAAYGSGEVILAAGDHSITIQGNAAGGLPARFFARLDLPEPGTWWLFSLGLAGFAICRRRRR